MTDRDHFDDPSSIVDRVQNTIRADAESPRIGRAQFFYAFGLGSASRARTASLTRLNATAGKRSISFSADRLMKTV
jgi:hypothetical protein